mgnify:FL=1
MSYREQLKQFFAKTFKGWYIEVTRPKKFLLGCGIPDYPIVIRPSTLTLKIEKHNLTREDLIRLNTQLNSPLMVFKGKQIGNAFNIVIEKTNEEGFLCCSVHPEYKINKLLVNDIASIHGRRITQLTDWCENGLLVNSNIEKTKKILSDSCLNDSKCEYLLSLLDTANIKKDSEKPNNDAKKLNGLDEQELLELEAEALALILQLEVNKGNQRKSTSNSTPKYKVGDVFVALNNDRYWKITSILTSNEDITYFVDEYRKGKSKTYHTDQQSFSESELENKMLAQGAVLQKDRENKNSYPERNGEITADILKKTFDFRYVNVDINLDEKQEQDMLDVSYDTFRQLAMLLNIPMNAIGLGRNLTLNIGLMRMDLTTGACYSPQYRALNFKGLESFKHIAHEWFHAFDHYLNYAHDNMNAKGLFSKECYNETTHYGIPAQDNIAAVIKAIDGTPYYSRSAGVAKVSRFGKYWTSNCEMLARAFEVYVKNLMEKHDINNSHLVSLFPNNPYPNYSDPKDMPIQDAFKVLFDSLTMKKTIYGDEALYGN